MRLIEQFRAGVQEITSDFNNEMVQIQANRTTLTFLSGPDYDQVLFGVEARGAVPPVTIKLNASGNNGNAVLDRFMLVDGLALRQWTGRDLLAPQFNGVRLTTNRLQLEALRIVRRPLASSMSRLALSQFSDEEGEYFYKRGLYIRA